MQACGLGSSDEHGNDSDDEHAQQDDLSPPSDDTDEDYTEESQGDAHAAPSPASEVKEQEPEDVTGEEDGHQNAEGADYREPRTAFIGTRWNGIKNAYIRIDEHKTDRPRGSRPLGYTWVPSINGYRRVLSQTLVDEERINLQAKIRQRPAREGLETLFGDDVPNCSFVEISFYVSAMGHSVPICWFELLSRAWSIAVDQSGPRARR